MQGQRRSQVREGTLGDNSGLSGCAPADKSPPTLSYRSWHRAYGLPKTRTVNQDSREPI